MPYEPPRGFRASLRAGDTKFGLLALSGSPQLVEMGGFLGMDFVLLDMEHSDGVGTAEVLHLIRAADAARIPALVRVPRNEPELIQRVLDFGAAGICVPHVSSPADAARAIAHVKFPPAGKRSTCPYTRAGSYGGRGDVAGYTADANQETVVMVLVEDPEGVAVLDQIVAVPGLDVIGIGLSDLARALGLPGDTRSPELDLARRRSAALARRHGLAASAHLGTSLALDEGMRRAELEELRSEGFSVFSWQDTSVFREAVLGLLEPCRTLLRH